jgi:hypothetical protein
VGHEVLVDDRIREREISVPEFSPWLRELGIGVSEGVTRHEGISLSV